MKRNRTVLLAALLAGSANAQEVIATQGETYSEGSAKVSFTIGEAVIDTYTNSTNDITQGFNQSTWAFVGLEKFDLEFDATIFPNPASDFLNIRTATFESVFYSLYDPQGKLVKRGALVGETTPIPVEEIARGNYSIVLQNQENTNLTTFKLIKL